MKKMSELAPISVICPVYNGSLYLEELYNSLIKQKNVKISELIFPLTDSKDESEKILTHLSELDERIIIKKIKPSDFSHSLTRETAAFFARGKILVFITQDIDIRTDNWLEKLISPLISNEADASYSRQKSKYNNLEKYTREYNYPKNSFIVSKDDINKKGLKTFFFSDAAGAILKEKFVELKGYDGKKMPISEDMYFAYKLIMSGGKIKYCADSVVYHSHKFTLKELYRRYKLTGKFFKQNNYLDKYGTTSSGFNLAKYTLKRIIKEKQIGLLFYFPFDMSARYLGMKVGKR